MVYKRFVEVGRVALVNYGPDSGKLCAIVDVVDETRVLVCGPHVERQAIGIKRVALTDLTIEIPRSSRAGIVNKAWTKAEIDSKWDQTAWAKKLRARKARAELSDFDRFKVMINRKKRAQITNREVAKLKKSA